MNSRKKSPAGATIKILFRYVSLITGNDLAQKMLRAMSKALRYLQGIGAGANFEISGERFLIKSVLKSDRDSTCVVFDVGANVGEFSQEVLHRRGDGKLELHAFEPTNSAFAQLRSALAPRDGLYLNRCALGQVRAEMPIYFDAPASGLASLTRRNLSFRSLDMSQQETVLVRTLDDYCAETGVKRIDFLKIDVEGHELDVLRGAVQMLERRAIQRIMWEFGGANLDTRTTFRDFWEVYGRYGFGRIYRLVPPGHLHRVRAYDESLEQYTTTNYVACLGR